VTNELTNVQMKKKWMNVKLITYLGNSHWAHIGSYWMNFERENGAPSLAKVKSLQDFLHNGLLLYISKLWSSIQLDLWRSFHINSIQVHNFGSFNVPHFLLHFEVQSLSLQPLEQFAVSF
jgi:hypothetical protein